MTSGRLPSLLTRCADTGSNKSEVVNQDLCWQKRQFTRHLLCHDWMGVMKSCGFHPSADFNNMVERRLIKKESRELISPAV